MKTTSRKRLLISSVAMLLVAMLALGTATFAWFTSNTTATADGIAVKTAKTSTLEISKTGHNWGTYVNYNHSKTMFPASTATGTSFFKAIAEKSSESTLKSGSITPASGDVYYFADQLNVRNNGDGKVKRVTIEISNFTNRYGRIAIVPANEAGEITYPEGKSFKDYVYDTDGESYTGLGSTTGAGNVEITADSSMTVTVGDLDKNGVQYYNLYVWFEGQDEQCIDDQAGQNLDDIATDPKNKLTFTVTGTPDDSGITG